LDRCADALCRIGILRGVAEADSPPACAPTRFSGSTPIPAPLVLCRAENALRSQSQANVAVRRPVFAAPAAAIGKAKKPLRVANSTDRRNTLAKGSAGVSKSSVCRGRSFSRRAMALSLP